MEQPYQADWIAEQENIKLSKEIEAALLKLTQRNIVLMSRKMGGNITFNEHLTIQRTIQAAKACIAVDTKEQFNIDKFAKSNDEIMQEAKEITARLNHG